MRAFSECASSLAAWVLPRKPGKSALPASSPWLSTLAAVEAELNQLNRSTETDFLAVGGMLTEFISAARRISSDISGMAQLISGEQGQSACDALAAVLDRAGHMQEDALATDQRLRQLSDTASKIGNGFSGFQQTVSSFRLVATLARIETERLGSADSGLGHLAEEFRSHAGKVVARVSDILDDVATVQKRISSTVANVSDLQSRKLKTLPALIAGTEVNLAAFRARQEQAVAASDALAAQFQTLSGAVARIVSSLQSHDITRQQIEHVSETIADILRKTGGSDLSPQTGMILRLQRAQLHESERLFAGSLDDIDRQLETISLQIDQMISTQNLLSDNGQGSGDSFLLEMQRSFAVILDAVSNCDGLEDSVMASMTELAEILNRLSVSLNDIRHMALQVKWLALNARVSAIHLGIPGEPLNVIAEAMQGLEVNCELHCEQTDAGIGSMRTVVTLHGIGSLQENGAPGAGLDVRERIDSLRAAGEHAADGWKRVNQSALALQENVQSARQRLSVPRRISGALSRCAEALRPLGSETTPSQIENDDELIKEFEQIARRYTMQAERDIHERFVGRGKNSPVEESSTSDAPPSAETEFGENIELF